MLQHREKKILQHLQRKASTFLNIFCNIFNFFLQHGSTPHSAPIARHLLLILQLKGTVESSRRGTTDVPNDAVGQQWLAVFAFQTVLSIAASQCPRAATTNRSLASPLASSSRFTRS
ncbi:hypothetical protein SEVIR_2G111750v4 [Setaria viridis]